MYLSAYRYPFLSLCVLIDGSIGSWQLVRHSEGEREIVQVVLKNSVEELEKSELNRKALEDRLKVVNSRVAELTATVERLQKQQAQSSPVQVQILDKSPSGVAHQVHRSPWFVHPLSLPLYRRWLRVWCSCRRRTNNSRRYLHRASRLWALWARGSRA